MKRSPNLPGKRDMELIDSIFTHELKAGNLPFSFNCGDRSYTGLPEELTPVKNVRAAGAGIIETVFCGRSGDLQITAEIVRYRDYPVFEQTVWFENIGKSDTENISGVKTGFHAKGEKPVISHGTGDYYSFDGLETKYTQLENTLNLAPTGGRGCNECFPYMRVLFAGHGLNVVVGWPGQWSAQFKPEAGGVTFECGQETLDACLRPGEKIRTPRVCVMAFEGGERRAANMWRRFYFDYVMPRRSGGKQKPLMFLHHGGGGEEFTLATEENQLRAIDGYIERGFKPDAWWIDAGWYPCTGEDGHRRWWETGSWRPDPVNFPNSLRPVGEKLEQNNIDFLLWHEPERVREKTDLFTNHRDWLLAVQRTREDGTEETDQNYMLWLGNPDARKWLTDLVNDEIKTSRINIYRQDFNFDPLEFWRQNDENRRIGMRENLHIQGYLQFWDDILLENPDLLIDSCASGGRRNDYETMRRSVPLHFTDFGYGHHPVKQSFARTMFEWIPYFRVMTLSWDNAEGSYEPQGETRLDSFNFHNSTAPSITFMAEYDAPEQSLALCRAFEPIWRRAAELTQDSDFYALTPYSKENTSYFAVQFDRPEADCGYIQIIANTKAADGNVRVTPAVSQRERDFIFENPETGQSFRIPCSTAADTGLNFELAPRSGMIWFYRTV